MRKLKKIIHLITHHKYATTIVVFVVLIVWLDSNSLYNRYILYQEQRQLQEQINAYNAQYQRDTRLYHELQRDPNAAIRIAREKYYMKNDNEDVYVFENETTD